MLFNSWEFITLLAVTVIIYYSVGKLFKKYTLQIATLIIASFVFYAFENPSLLLLLLISIGINTLAGFWIVSKQLLGKQVKSILFLSVGINLLFLAFFKYASFLGDIFLYSAYFTVIRDNLTQIPLPIGISFYTFQAISLLVDLDRKGESKLRSLKQGIEKKHYIKEAINIAFYIAFFPQLIAGPIVKAHDFFEQIKPKYFRDIKWQLVIQCLIYGYFLKMVIADNLKDISVYLTTIDLLSQGAINLLILLYAYSIQIFADFAGYSLIAIGLGYLFGYNFPRNFNFPYISSSITEFWQRWHISLSSWLKEYLYIPLGGNRKGANRTYLNLMIVMLLGGLWHGADTRYLVWGGAHGLLLALERFGVHLLKKVPTPFKGFKSLIKIIKIGIIFHVVSFLWLLFLMPEFSYVINYFQGLARGELNVNFRFAYILFMFALPVILAHGFYLLNQHYQIRDQQFFKQWAEPLLLAFLLFMITVNSGSSGEFIYFQF